MRSGEVCPVAARDSCASLWPLVKSVAEHQHIPKLLHALAAGAHFSL